MRKNAAIALSLAITAGSAQATWSILLVDMRTGEMALASATCLTGFDLRANTPVMIVGTGGITAQSAVDQRGYNRTFARDRLLEGVDPATIIDLLANFDNAHQSRQYGMMDTQGRPATFTGSRAGLWAGGFTGSFQSFHAGVETTIVYAIQGNVLTGEPVVAMAIDAVMNTPGDLAERLMAGMEAAHSMGGDGRCSCSPQDPDSCGSPPGGYDPETDKSAHIAYMLIGRAGDLDSCLSVYRVEPASNAIAFMDIDGDGMADVLTTGNLGLYKMTNSTPDSRFVKLDEAELIGPLPARGEFMRVGDVTGDGNEDVVVVVPSDRAVHVFPGDGLGGFGASFALADLASSPAGLALGDLNGDSALDIVTSTGNGDGVAIYLSDGAGGFDPVVLVGLGDTISNVAILDADGDGDLDIAAVQGGLDRVALVVNNAGVFGAGATLATANDPIDLVAADLDGDGDTDLGVACRVGRSISVLTQDGGSFSRADVVGTQRMVKIDAGDADGDGDLDLLAMRLGGARFATFLNDGGTFSIDSEINQLAGGGRGFDVLDVTGDGLVDVVSGGGTPGISALASLGPDNPVGLYPRNLGCASGDYFMTFNVANQNAGNDDPTRQLRGLFDTWRTELIGRPDAVTSRVDLASELFADGRQTTMTVTLMDWQETSIASPSLRVEHAPGSDGRTTIGKITDLGGGVFEVAVGGASEAGTDILRVTADDGSRPVVLMPEPTIEVVLHPADIDGDGDVDAEDFFAYLDLFVAGDDRADIDRDGDIDADDFFAFLDLFVL